VSLIDRVEVELVEVPAMHPFRWRDGLPGSEPALQGGVLTITTSDGVVGRASTPRGVIAADLVNRRVRDELIGQDAMHREWLWHRIWELDRIEEFPLYFLGLVDIALWDIAGQVAGLPVHALAGTYRTSLPAYASTVTYGSIEEYLDIADQCLERGFKAIKLHAWGDVVRDARLAQRLREHVGDDVELMYDGSAGFDLPDAIRLGKVLSDLDFRWYEEPMREFNITSHRWLAERVDVPLLVGETSDGAHFNTADFIQAGTATYVRTSAGLKGGITGALRIAHLAESFGLRAEVHGMGVPNQHLCMTIPNTTYYEALVWGNPIITDPSVDADGLIHASTAPGLSSGLS
jgi:L-alanine-DL-glutamate epimerase-like enolase superfamily enzyme